MIKRGIRLLLCVLLLPAPSFAGEEDQLERELRIGSREDLVDAYGLIVGRPTVQGVVPPAAFDEELAAPKTARRSAALRRISEGSWAVRVRLRPDDVARSAHMTVIASTVSGEALSGRMEPLGGVGDAAAARTCDQPEAAVDAQEAGGNPEAQEEQKHALIAMLHELLDEKAAAELGDLEEQFGLRYRRPISPDLPLQELVSRVAAIDAFLAQHRKP